MDEPSVKQPGFKGCMVTYKSGERQKLQVAGYFTVGNIGDSAEKRPSRLDTRLIRFSSDLVSSYLQADINKFPSAYNRRHGFRKIIPCRGVPT